MKKLLLLFVYIVFLSIHTQAQNSTLWYKIQEIRQQYFPETINEGLHSSVKSGPGLTGTNPHKSYAMSYFKSPAVIIDNEYVSFPGSTNSEQEALSKINSYQLTQIAGVNYITTANNFELTTFYGASGGYGVILIYTHQFVASNPWARDTFKISFEGQIGNKEKKSKK
ncbi:hypothetical protein AD998_06015 [bacterium 336/3]|nr:hypothetical protein AD998_06015 [bacterium 336/3]